MCSESISEALCGKCYKFDHHFMFHSAWEKINILQFNFLEHIFQHFICHWKCNSLLYWAQPTCSLKSTDWISELISVRKCIKKVVTDGKISKQFMCGKYLARRQNSFCGTTDFATYMNNAPIWFPDKGNVSDQLAYKTSNTRQKGCIDQL
jgi:hypothetical protein